MEIVASPVWNLLVSQMRKTACCLGHTENAAVTSQINAHGQGKKGKKSWGGGLQFACAHEIVFVFRCPPPRRQGAKGACLDGLLVLHRRQQLAALNVARLNAFATPPKHVARVQEHCTGCVCVSVCACVRKKGTLGNHVSVEPVQGSPLPRHTDTQTQTQTQT